MPSTSSPVYWPTSPILAATSSTTKHIVLRADQSLPFAVVRSVLLTLRSAGLTSITLVIRKGLPAELIARTAAERVSAYAFVSPPLQSKAYSRLNDVPSAKECLNADTALSPLAGANLEKVRRTLQQCGLLG